MNPDGADKIDTLPRPSLSLGIVGHRAERVSGALADEVGKIIGHIIADTAMILKERSAKSRQANAAYGPGAPVMSLVSCLAQGSDTIAAEALLEAKKTTGDIELALDVILPFSRDKTCEGQRSDAQKVRFEHLVDQARSCLILGLPCDAQMMPAAYDLAGQILLSQTDILIAVWDGGLSRGRGGTRDMVDRALRLGLPIVHINIAPTTSGNIVQTHLLSGDINGVTDRNRHVEDARLACIELSYEWGAASCQNMCGLVARLIEPLSIMRASDHDHQSVEDIKQKKHDRKALERFLDGQKSYDQTQLTKAAKDLEALIAPFAEGALEPQKQGAFSPLPRLLHAFAAADSTANHYAGKFRPTVIGIFICAAVAIAAAALSTVIEKVPHLVFVLVELTAIIGMMWLTWNGRKQQYHRRWIDARDIAERLRLSLVFWPLGIWPWPLSAADQWIGWYVRAHLREQALCDNRNRPDWLLKAKDVLLRHLDGQIRYHRKTFEKMHRTAGLMETATQLGLVWTIFGLLSGLIVELKEKLHFGTLHSASEIDCLWSWLPVVTIILSAASFAVYGIKVTRDYEGVGERSQKLKAELEDHKARLETKDNIVPIHASATNLSDAMLDELRHWRITAESRVLDMPG